MHPLKFTGWAIIVALALCAALLLFLELGRRWALTQLKRHGPAARTGVGVVDGSVYGLLALLIGFTFASAAGRFDSRRQLIAAEANALSTAWQRVDLLPPDQQEPIRGGLRQYIDAVIASYERFTDGDNVLGEPPQVAHARDELWREVVAACARPTCDQARMLLVPSMNELFDTVDDERYARRVHPPSIIFVMLAIAALASSLFIGYGLASVPERNWLYIIGFALSVSIATYAIIDLEYPRLGLIQVSAMDRVLVEQRATMQPAEPRH